MVTITIIVTIIVTTIVTIMASDGNNYTTKMALLAAFVSINIYHRILFLTFWYLESQNTQIQIHRNTIPGVPQWRGREEKELLHRSRPGSLAAWKTETSAESRWTYWTRCR